MTASREETARARHVFFLGALADAVSSDGIWSGRNCFHKNKLAAVCLR